MPEINESQLEEFAINLLKEAGFQCVYGPDIAPDSETPERDKFKVNPSPSRNRRSLSWQNS
jgi:type I restriction enzyme R subunit